MINPHDHPVTEGHEDATVVRIISENPLRFEKSIVCPLCGRTHLLEWIGAEITEKGQCFWSMCPNLFLDVSMWLIERRGPCDKEGAPILGKKPTGKLLSFLQSFHEEQ